MTEGRRHALEIAGWLNLEEIDSYKIDYKRFRRTPGSPAIWLIPLVGAVRFERTTPCAQGRCATRLRYAPTSYAFDFRPLSSPVQLLLVATVAKP